MDINIILRDIIAQINFFIYDVTLAVHNFLCMIGII